MALVLGLVQGCGWAFHYPPTHEPPFPEMSAPGKAAPPIPLKVAFKVSEDLRGPSASVYTDYTEKFHRAFVDGLISARPFSKVVELKGDIKLADYDLYLEIGFEPEYDFRNKYYEMSSASLLPGARYQFGHLEVRIFATSNREFLKRYYFKTKTKGVGWVWGFSTLPSVTMEDWGYGFARRLGLRLLQDRGFFEGLEQPSRPRKS